MTKNCLTADTSLALRVHAYEQPLSAVERWGLRLSRTGLFCHYSCVRVDAVGSRCHVMSFELCRLQLAAK